MRFVGDDKPVDLPVLQASTFQAEFFSVGCPKPSSRQRWKQPAILPSLNVKTARSRRGIVPFTHLARKGRMTVTIGRRELLAALGGGAVAWPLVARAQGKSAARVLKYVPHADLTFINQFVTTANITRYHALMIWDQLYGIDSDLRPHPQMVEGHTVEEDGKHWTFRLREGLRFHDGEPVRGRDCIASIRRWATRDSLGQALMAHVAEMSAPEDRVFSIRLHRPFSLMLDALAKGSTPPLCIMPERLALTDPYQPIKEIVGSGPFKWVADERIVGARVVYERYAGYRPRESGTTDCLAGPKIVKFD